ncbi:MAG: hypothetical protein EOP83_06230 [Verrucomicrobiaceae bacterium]|nr:MAG: hypothetical protein EOP83_06230 [Verrucomicrobiaceae bacterium]
MVLMSVLLRRPKAQPFYDISGVAHSRVFALPPHLAEFFGVDFEHQVSTLIWLVPWSGETGLPPECFRGRPKLVDLPRFTLSTSIDYSTIIEIHELRQADIALRVSWVVENLSGPWSVAEMGILLAHPDDAFAYRMRWDDPCEAC